MPEHHVTITTQDGQLDAWLHTPEGQGPWPGVILHTDIRGVRESFQDMARTLAGHGYAVLLPNLYYRVAKVPVARPGLSFQDEEGRRHFGALRDSLSASGLQRDHQALLNWLDRQPQVKPGGVAIVGYCMSGAIALNVAADFPEQIRAAASFHGGNLVSDQADSPHLQLPRIKAELLFGHAHNDPYMPEERIVQLEQALQQSGLRYQSLRLQAAHGFAVADSPAYDPQAADQHWQSLLALLEGNFAR